ncbi:MAG: 5-formyltetrahydrofolate cyclo-ligase, partial [Proteobacteria bacterium]|nr:5-formyltetrahydrofolate cyclo-ligase [Pseudomonadota bacterium]
MIKSNIRKKILDLRKKNKKILKVDLDSVIKILENEKIKGKKVGGYYPVNFE